MEDRHLLQADDLFDAANAWAANLADNSFKDDDCIDHNKEENAEEGEEGKEEEEERGE